MDLLLAIDAGTTAVKAALFDEQGRLVAGSTQEYDLLTPAGDRVELPADVYWESTVAAIRETLARSGAAAERVVAAGVTSQGETLIPIDQEGRPLHHAIVWLDNRAAVEARRVAGAFDADRFYRTTGLPEIIPTWPACKLLWLREQRPDLFARLHKVLLVEDYILYRLSGRIATEGTVCSSTGYYDVRAGTWWDEMLAFLELGREHLPTLLHPGEAAGPLTDEAARETGLAAATLAVAGCMDQLAGAVGSGNLAPGVVSETTGTALALAATVERPTYDPLKRLPCYAHALPGRYLLLPYCQTAGMAFRWFRDRFGEGAGYDDLTAQAASVDPGCDGLAALPHLAGSTSPRFNPGARGVFYGVTLQHTRAHFVRALLESVAFMLRENVDLLRDLGVQVEELISLGGGARSDLWLQIKADVTGLPLRVPACEEAASLGAAILAGVAAGLFPDVETACRQMVRTGKRVTPEPARRGAYDAAYERYTRLYESLEPLFDEEK